MITVDSNVGERAILIKVHGGDWALLVGQWKGVTPGVKGSFSESNLDLDRLIRKNRLCVDQTIWS